MKKITAIISVALLGWTLQACHPVSAADMTQVPQLYAPLENGVLILTVQPCDVQFGQPSLFEFAAYAVVKDEPDTKEGCWFAGDGTVNMVFPDQPGVHSWSQWLFTPNVPTLN